MTSDKAFIVRKYCNKTFWILDIVQFSLSSSGLQIRSVLNTNLISCARDFIESGRRLMPDSMYFSFFVLVCRASVGVLFSPLVSSPPYLEFLTFSFLLARSVHLISQLYSLQLSEDNNDVRVWLPVAAIMRSFLCLHFVPGCVVHLMSWKFFKISFWGCFVTATFSECGLYLWKMMAPCKCVVSPKVRYVTGLIQIEFYPPVSHLMTREHQLSSRLPCAPSNSSDHGGPRRRKIRFTWFAD